MKYTTQYVRTYLELGAHPPCAPLGTPFDVKSCGIVTHHEIAYHAFETFNSDVYGGPGYMGGIGWSMTLNLRNTERLNLEHHLGIARSRLDLGVLPAAKPVQAVRKVVLNVLGVYYQYVGSTNWGGNSVLLLATNVA